MTTPNRISQLNSKYQAHSSSQPADDLPIYPSLRRSQIAPIPRSGHLIPSPISIQQHQHRPNPLTTSQVTVTHTPAILKATTTPPTVYEIVQPIIEITPTVISQHKTQHHNLPSNQSRPLYVAEGKQKQGDNQDEVEFPSPPPLNFRRKRSGFVKKGCGERFCGWLCCPWWVCCLLVTLGLLGLGLGAVRYWKPDFFGAIKKSEEKREQISVVVEPKVFEEEDKQYVKQIQDLLRKNKQQRQKQPLPPKQNENDEQDPPQTNKTIELLNTPHPPYNSSKQNEKQIITITNVTCPPGFFFYGKKCLLCPDGSVWNGTACIKRVFVIPPQIRKQNKNNEKQTDLPSNTDTNNNDKNQNKKVSNDPDKDDIYVANAWSVVQPRKHFLHP